MTSKKEFPSLDKKNIHKLPDGEFLIYCPTFTQEDLERLAKVISENRPKAKGHVIVTNKKMSCFLDKKRLSDAIEKIFSEGFYNYFHQNYGTDNKETNERMFEDINRKVDELKKELGL